MVAPQSLAPKQATVLSGGIGGMGSQMMTSPQYMQQAPVQSFAAPQMMVQQAPLQTMAAPQYIQQAQTFAPTSMMRGASFGRTNMIRGASFGRTNMIRGASFGTNMIRGASFGTGIARAWELSKETMRPAKFQDEFKVMNLLMRHF